MRDRRIAVALVVALLFAIAVRHPSADIRIITHDQTDLSPRRVQAAIDTGLFGVSVLITWTKRFAG